MRNKSTRNISLAIVILVIASLSMIALTYEVSHASRSVKSTLQTDCDESNGETLIAVYRQVLERDLDPVGRSEFGKVLSRGWLSIRELVRNLCKSDEYKDRFVKAKQPEEVVRLLYKHVLNRNVDPVGRKEWSKVLTQYGYDAVVNGLIDSKEYKDKFGDHIVPGHSEVRACRGFPLEFHREDNFGSHHMITNVIISKDGSVDVITETNNHVALKGNCGQIAVWLLDKDGNILQRNGTQKFCVDGTKVLWGQSVRKDTWNFSISPNNFGQVRGVSILQTNGSVNPLNLIKENLQKVKEIWNIF